MWWYQQINAAKCHNNAGSRLLAAGDAAAAVAAFSRSLAAMPLLYIVAQTNLALALRKLGRWAEAEAAAAGAVSLATADTDAAGTGELGAALLVLGGAGGD